MKKFLAIVLAAVMALSMVSFASAENPLAGEYEIKVWVADAIVDLTDAQIKRFNETNEDGIIFKYTINITNWKIIYSIYYIVT
jgi:arabinogalactan oligomer/maltooligosaccharide transport system substrate-binding protein